MDIFTYREELVADYASFLRSFIRIRGEEIREFVDAELRKGILWPDPLLQLNPSFEPGALIDDLVSQGVLHELCGKIFRMKSEDDGFGQSFRLHKHQEEAVHAAQREENYVLTTGTGSGKSLAYIIPAVDHVLKNGAGNGIQAIVVYPMNALANSQKDELDKFLKLGFPEGNPPVTYRTYTGQEGETERESIRKNPPDILLTNYVMLELILTRVDEIPLIRHAADLKFLVLDELHTYRGRQGADVAMLVRRAREAFSGERMLCVGTSATMASGGDSETQRVVVAEVATKIFGSEVKPDSVVIETLRRQTEELDLESGEVVDELGRFIESDEEILPDFETLKNTHLASWLESTFGLRKEATTDRLVRHVPISLTGNEGAAAKLVGLTKSDIGKAERRIQAFLMAASEAVAESGYPLFAFRLHQFMTRGDTVWGTLEHSPPRYLTLRGQQYVPGEDRSRRLFPMVFCRCCGQEYYRVDRIQDDPQAPFVPRMNFKLSDEENVQSGYLYLSTDYPWPLDDEEVLERLPEDWLEETNAGVTRVIRQRRERVPEGLTVQGSGAIGDKGTAAAWIPGTFTFCLNPECGVSYNLRRSSDVNKLATLGIDGRSTATSIMALSVVQNLRRDETLEDEAKKVLSFTDNRQDASLQAGHFNDFVQVGFQRASLYKALLRAGEDGLRYDAVVHDLERSMNLPADFYANDPDIRGPALEETKRALRGVLEYLIYRDLKRGWRLTSPNLEQCGLLRIEYLALDDVANDDELWAEQNAHELLLNCPPERKKELIRIFLDLLRRSLCIKTDSLERIPQERMCTTSSARLRDPWVFDDFKDLERSGIAWPRSRFGRARDDLFVSPQSNYGQYLRRQGVLRDEGRITLEETGQVIRDLFRCLSKYGLVEQVRDVDPNRGDAPGYQVPASVFIWREGDGSTPLDELRVIQGSEQAQDANVFFTNFYRQFADVGVGLKGREHTAQVFAEDRKEREDLFKAGKLALLFCSPTMELGVDIAQLNVVNMRNVPPTPANYAQRSGRAGRGGQPALVYTYCSGFSPHDQYYFQRPNAMVAGTVSAPRIDLMNQDLVRSHIQAVWLAAAQLKLGKTLAEVLTVAEGDLSLPIKDEIREKLRDAGSRHKARDVAQKLLEGLALELEGAAWLREDWLENVLQAIPSSFEHACERWRSLYRSAVQQRTVQNTIIGDHTRPAEDRARAKSLRRQAETQIELLTNAKNAMEGDFYSYRYFASEGFLPGYNFPRLPLSAFIPSRRGRRGRDEFLSRPRFLAISEFGPQALVYHEGAQYRINKVNIAFDEDSNEINKAKMKNCPDCGYGHYVVEDPGPDTCDNCSSPLGAEDEIREMVRLQNVSTIRVNRITSDEEERQRLGYEIATSYRFQIINGIESLTSAQVLCGEEAFGTIRYGDAATIWRINLGWARTNKRGFQLDPERGTWGPSRVQQADGQDGDNPNQTFTETVVPFVEDRRNLFVLSPVAQLDNSTMATLQAALKQAIQQTYLLEPAELAAESLPSSVNRRVILFYEAAEGGAGVLRQLLEDPEAFAKVAQRALEICHYDPVTGEDKGADAGGGMGCEAACYDCLLEYGNQRDHRQLDRDLTKDILTALTKARVECAPGAGTRESLLDELYRSCDSGLEKKWLKQAADRNHLLPDEGQLLISECSTRPDFYYRRSNATIYVDGPPHDDPEQKRKDEEITANLVDKGYLVIRFHHKADWAEIFDHYADVFGPAK